MPDAKITISAQDLASDVFAKVSAAMKATGQATVEVGQANREAAQHAEGFHGVLSSLFNSFPAHVAEGVLLRDAIHEILKVTKEALEALPELIEHAMHVGNSLFEMSLKTGASVENLSALRYVASQTGMDFESFGNTMFKMEMALGSTGAKADSLQGHLDTLGLNLKTLKNEKPDQAFIDIMTALEEIPNRADQAAAGMAIFGKGFKDMAGLTQESIKDLMAEAQHLGLVMSTDTAAAAHAAEIGMKSLEMQFESLGLRLGAAFLPALVGLEQNLTEVFQEAVHEANGGLDAMGGSGGFLHTVAAAMGQGDEAIDAQVQLYEDLKSILIGVAQYGIEPMITGISYLMIGWNAGKVLLGDVVQVINYLALGYEHAVLAVDKFQRLGTSGAERAYWDTEVSGAQATIAQLNLEVEARAAQIGADKQAEADWSDWATKATNEVEEAVNALAHSHTNAAEEIKKYAEISHKAMGGVADDAETATKAMKKHAEAVAAAIAGLEGDSKTTHIMVEALVALAKSGNEDADVIERMTAAITKLEDKAIPLPDILYKWDEAHRQNLDAHVIGVTVLGNYRATVDYATKSGWDFATATRLMANNTQEFGLTLPDVRSSLDVLASTELPNVSDAFMKVTESTNAWGWSLNATLDKVPHLIEAGFTGGGGMSGAVKAIGADFGKNLGGSLQDSITEHMPSSITSGMVKAIGSVAGGLASGGISLAIQGAMMGIGKLMKIGKPSKEELAGRTEEANFQDQFGSFDEMMKKVGEAYAATGRSAQQAEADVKHLMDAEKQGGAAVKGVIDTINGAFKDQQQDASDLKAAIQEYHFSIDELGPAMQKQQLTEQAVALENKFRLLAGSGIDVTTVLDHMGGSINDFLHAAMRTGQDVPAEMKPMIEKMIEMGTLTDANGKKIDSLDGSGLTFSETMTQGFDRVVKELDKVFDRLGLLPAAAQTAASHIPTNPFRDWIPPDIQPGDFGQPPGASTGGWVTDTGIQHLAAGGFARGSDTVPAMLTPGELVLNQSQIAAVRALNGGRGGDTWNVAVTVNGAIDSAEGQRKLGQQIFELIVNEAGLRRRWSFA